MYRENSNLTISNALSLIRIILVPFIIFYMLKSDWLMVSIIYTFAALTDLFDGALARYLNCETILGSYLDPIADKIFFLSIYISIVFIDISIVIPNWFIFLGLFKEILLIIGFCYIYFEKKNKSEKEKLKPSFLGKFTSALQSLFIGIVFIGQVLSNKNLNSYFNQILPVSLYITAIFIIFTLFHYFYLNFYLNFKKSFI